MKVNFNNVRKQALYRYDALVDKLNFALIKDDDRWCRPNDVTHGMDINLRGYVVIDAEDIQEILNDLRMMIGTIASCHEDGNEDMKDVFSEVYPESEKCMKVFNEDTE